MTPLPKKQFFILAIVQLSEPISFSMIFPFIYFMVLDFNLTNNINTPFYSISSNFATNRFYNSESNDINDNKKWFIMHFLLNPE